MFEAIHSEEATAPPDAVWELWADPDRWPQWNDQIESGELEGDFAVGETVRVKLRRGGKMRFEIIALEPERLFIDEARFPGARFGHEHRLEPRPGGCEITHRLYVSGFASGVWSLMMGRKRMRESVAGFAAREREIAEAKATPRASGKRKRRR